MVAAGMLPLLLVFGLQVIVSGSVACYSLLEKQMAILVLQEEFA